MGIVIDENITWNDHIDIVEKQISKSIVTLYEAKFVLDQKYLKHIYFALFNTYIKYANTAWTITSYTKLKNYIINKNMHSG